MRESNFSNPAQNKACVCISATLYDRRAIDCTATLPLINSLNHLAYLTSTSPRIREMVTLDGGLERLIRILRTVPKSAPSPGGSLIPTKASTTLEMQAIWKWSLAFQCVVNIGVRGSETVRTRVVEAGMVPVTVGVLESYLKMVDTHKHESKKEDRERESRERREERERQRRADRQARQDQANRHALEASNDGTQRLIEASSSTDRTPQVNYIEEIPDIQTGSSNQSSSSSSSSTSRSNRQASSNSSSTSRPTHSNISDVTMQIAPDFSSEEVNSVIPISATSNSSRPDDVEVVEAGSDSNGTTMATVLSSFSDATEIVLGMASGSGTLTNVSSVEDLRSGSGSGSGSEGAEDAAMDADAEGDGDGSSVEDEGRPISGMRRNTVQQSHFARPQQLAEADAGADADTEMEGSVPPSQTNESSSNDERDQEPVVVEEEERRTPRPSRRALAPLSSTTISSENSTQPQAGPSSTPMGSRNRTITPSTTRPSRQSTSSSQSRSNPTGAESHVQATRAAEQVQVTRAPPALNVDGTSTSSSPLNGGEMAYREEEVLLSLQLLAYLSKYAHVRVLFHNAEMAVTALPGPLSAMDDEFDMIPVACSEVHEHGSACTASRDSEIRTPPARNVFSVAERFTLRSSRSGSSVSATAHSKLAPEIQYWAGVIMRNACRKDEGRGGIRQCANMLCGKWEAYPREFAKCRRCRKAKYCSKACQSKGWQMGHRFWCSAREDEGREKEREKEKSGLSNGAEDEIEETGRARVEDQDQLQNQPLNSATLSIDTPTDENSIPSTSSTHPSSNHSHNHHHNHRSNTSNTAGNGSNSESHSSRRERRQDGSSSHAGSSRRRGSGLLHHANSSETSFAAASASTSDVDTDASVTTAPAGGIDLDDADATSTGRDSEEEIRRAHRPRAGRSQLQHQRQHAYQPTTSDDIAESNERAHSHHGPLPTTQRTDLAGRPLPPPVIASHDASHVLGAGVGRNDDLDMELIGRRGTPGATHEAEGLFANGDFDQMRWRSNTLTPGSRTQALPEVEDSLGETSSNSNEVSQVESSMINHDLGFSSSSSSSSSSSNPYPNYLRAPVARQAHRFASSSGTGLSGLVVNSGISSNGFIPGHSHHVGSGSGIGLGQPSSPSYAHFQRGYGLDTPGPRSASSAANFPPQRSSQMNHHGNISHSNSPLSAGPSLMSTTFLPRSISQPNDLEDFNEISASNDNHQIGGDGIDSTMNLDDVDDATAFVNQYLNQSDLIRNQDEDVHMN